MTEFTSARLAELKAVAEAATQSSWHIENDYEEDYEAGIAYAEWPSVLVGPENAIPSQWARDHGDTDRVQEILELKPEDAAHIAAFDPQTVLALIAALEARTYEAQRLRAMGQGLIKQRDEARAAIERVREAATEVTNQGDNLVRTHYEKCWTHHLHCLAAKILHETEADDE